MNDDQIKIAREKVDKIFSDMQSGIKIETEENIKENTDETQKGISLAQVIECAGVSITTDLMSPKYKLVMKNMGDNDRAIMTALKGVIPLFLIKLSTEFHVPSDKIKELGMNLTELANVYTYALIKMTATEDISNITSPDKSAEGLEFFSELTLENKVLYILAGYHGCVLGFTHMMIGEEEAEGMQDMLGEYISTMSDLFTTYVSQERKKNGLKEE